MTLAFLDDMINQKMTQDEECVVFTFYELRVKSNLSTEDAQIAIHLAKQKLENNNYKVYTTGDEYIFKGENKVVQNNQLLVAIKEI